MKNKLQTLLACIAALALCAPLAAFAATKKSSPPASPSPAAKASPSPAVKASPSPAAKASPSPAAVAPTTRPIAFHGMISAVDQKAKTFTIAGKQKARVFKVTHKTVLTKAGAAATMKDVVANEEARGSYWNVADGSLEAKTVKLGPKTEAEKAAAAKKKSPKSEASPSPSASPSASTSPSPSASATP